MSISVRYDSKTWTETSFRKRVTEALTRSTVRGRQSAMHDVTQLIHRAPQWQEVYNEIESNLEGKPMATTNDHIEIKLGGITLRKQGTDLVIKLDTKFTYTEAAVRDFRTQLDSGLNIIEQAAKVETSTAKASTLDV